MVRSLAGKNPQYFEAIIQLRDITQEVIDYLEEALEKNKIGIAKVKQVKNGFDYYISDNDFAKAMGKRLQQRFGGQLLITASLFSKKENKEIFRVTVLFRSSPFQKNDLVDYQGEDYNVKGMAKDILLQNIKTGKKVHVKYKDMNQIKKK